MTDKLKPCPFCGGEAEVIKGYLYGKVTHYSVTCPQCDFEYGMYKSKQNAEKAWNRRKADNDMECMINLKIHMED